MTWCGVVYATVIACIIKIKKNIRSRRKLRRSPFPDGLVSYGRLTLCATAIIITTIRPVLSTSGVCGGVYYNKPKRSARSRVRD